MLKVSDFYLEKQKSFIPKKMCFKLLSISKQKSFDLLTQFSVKVSGFDFGKNECHKENVSFLDRIGLYPSDWIGYITEIYKSGNSLILRIWIVYESRKFQHSLKR